MANIVNGNLALYKHLHPLNRYLVTQTTMPPKTETMYDVYLAHTAELDDAARELKEYLEKGGMIVSSSGLTFTKSILIRIIEHSRNARSNGASLTGQDGKLAHPMLLHQ